MANERISEEVLDILQEDPIFLVGWPTQIFEAGIKDVEDRIKDAPKDQKHYVMAGIKAARILQDS